MAERVRTAAEHRRVTERRGRFAEAVALALLVLKGYRPLARRFRAAGAEVDLIVIRGGTVAFVEVKARGTMEGALTAIDAAKRRRVSRAARIWLARNPWAVAKSLRADAVVLAKGALPRHLEAAFELEMT